MTTSNIDRIALEWLLNALWQIGILSLVAIAVQPLLRNASAHFRHSYWLAASSLCVVVPVLSAVLLGLPGAVESRTSLIEATAGPASTALTPLVEPPITVPKELPPFAILIYVTCLGIALFRISRSICTVVAFRKKAAAGRPDPRLDEIVDYCRSVLGVCRVRAVASDTIESPVTIGFRKPLILVPSQLVNTADRSILLAIAGHEMAHIRRKDFLVNLLAQVLIIPVQFHPLIWYLVRKMRRQCELACDEIVTASLMSKRTYARRLLEVAAGSIKRETMRPQLAFGTDSLEERIRALLAPSKFVHSQRIQRLTMILACSILLTAGVGAGLVFVRAQDQPPPAGQVQARPSRDAPHIMSDEGFTPPKVLTQTIPSYTEEALSAGVQGAVLLSCIIWRTGRATDFLVLRGLPYGLDEAAINEIRDNWRFSPATFNGHAVDFQTTIEVTFNLRDRDRVSLSEAEGLIVERVELVGLSEEQAQRARALIKVGEQAKFQKAGFESDIKTLKEKFGSSAGTVYKGSSGRVIIKYRFAAK